MEESNPCKELKSILEYKLPSKEEFMAFTNDQQRNFILQHGNFLKSVGNIRTVIKEADQKIASEFNKLTKKDTPKEIKTAFVKFWYRLREVTCEKLPNYLDECKINGLFTETNNVFYKEDKDNYYHSIITCNPNAKLTDIKCLDGLNPCPLCLPRYDKLMEKPDSVFKFPVIYKYFQEYLRRTKNSNNFVFNNGCSTFHLWPLCRNVQYLIPIPLCTLSNIMDNIEVCSSCLENQVTRHRSDAERKAENVRSATQSRAKRIRMQDKE